MVANFRIVWATSKVIMHHTRLEFPHPIQCQFRVENSANVKCFFPQKHSANDLHASGDPIGTDIKPSFWSKNELNWSNQIETIWPRRNVRGNQFNTICMHKYSNSKESVVQVKDPRVEGLRLSINCSKRSKNRTATMANCCNFLAARSSKRRTTAELLSDWMNGLNEWRPKPFRLASLTGAWALQRNLERYNFSSKKNYFEKSHLLYSIF